MFVLTVALFCKKAKRFGLRLGKIVHNSIVRGYHYVTCFKD